ncbi:MAG: hypothetical protein ACRC8B_22875 [Aeromonas sobria]|uniref:hypothetical protein n=1 Tax=Aeromonas sobria TaxID=646 RepID=UPI003F2BC5CB
MKLDINHIESNLRHHSRPGAYPWFILLDANDQPLMVTPPGYRVEPAIWYKASLFTADRVAHVAAIASEQLGEQVKCSGLVQYLDKLRDDLVRAERAEAGATIHAV